MRSLLLSLFPVLSVDTCVKERLLKLGDVLVLIKVTKAGFCSLCMSFVPSDRHHALSGSMY